MTGSSNEPWGSAQQAAERLIYKAAEEGLGLLLPNLNREFGKVYAGHTETDVRTCLPALVPHLGLNDSSGLLLRCHPHWSEGGVGCVLFLRWRAIVAWTDGILPRHKPQAIEVPMPPPQKIMTVRTIPKTWRKPPKMVVELVGPPVVHLQFEYWGGIPTAVQVAQYVLDGETPVIL